MLVMNVLVLGGNGFIGSHLVDKLKAEGHTVSVFDRNPELFRKPISDVRYFQGEFGNRGLLGEALEGVDVVFHLISTTLPKTSNDDPIFDVQSNVVETLSLMEKCLETGVGKVVFVSSGGTIYGRPDRLPVDEKSATDPECSYGITKLVIEKYFALYHKLHGLEYTIVRPSNPYGERQNPSGIQGVISVFLDKAARGETIAIWGDGGIVRDYIYISDLVEGICRAAFMPTQSRIFNLGSGTGHTLNDILVMTREVTGRSVSVSYKERREFDVPEIYLDICRAKNELAWEPVTELKEGMMRTWDFIKKLT